MDSLRVFKDIIVWSEISKVNNISYKETAKILFRFFETHNLRFNSAMYLESIHRQYVNKYEWLHSNKILFTKMVVGCV